VINGALSAFVFTDSNQSTEFAVHLSHTLVTSYLLLLYRRQNKKNCCVFRFIKYSRSVTLLFRLFSPLFECSVLLPWLIVLSLVTSARDRSTWKQFSSLPRDAMLARYMLSSYVRLSDRLSVCLSHAGIVSKWSVQKTPHDSPGPIIFWYQRSGRNSNSVTPTGAPNVGGVG